MNKLVTVASYSHPAEAYIVKGLLENQGIEVYLYDERSAGYSPLITGGIRLAVKFSDLEEAVNILKLSENKEQE